MNPTPRSWKRQLLRLLPVSLQANLIAIQIYRRRVHRWPHLLRPQTVRDCIQAAKFWNHDPRIPPLADKIAVKEYVRGKLGDDWVIPTLWSGKALPPLSDRSWPMPFVIKANNAAGRNYFVRDPADLDWPAIEQMCQDWMASPFGLLRGEWLYTKIKPQILIEPFINFGPDRSDRGMPIDYKFWTFHGRVAFINVVTGRDDTIRLTVFDRHWRRCDANMGFPTEDKMVEPPVSLAQMIEAAERLAADLHFVRVDFYEVDGKPLFGEMTFYPGAGLDPFSPPAFDRYVRDLWLSPKGSAMKPYPPSVPV